MRPSLLPELYGHFRSHFVAALADARTDGGVEVVRVGGESAAHGLDGGGRNPRHGAAPSGMNGGDGAMAFVDQ